MQGINYFQGAFGWLDQARMPVRSWNLFVKMLALAFLAYWLHLSQGLNDWLGSEGFHLESSAILVFAPLPPPWELIVWWVIFAGNLLLFSQRSVALGSAVVGSGFFYATICDPVSTGALNMHFLFAFAVIFWSTGLIKPGDITMSAWPAFLIRTYLGTVYFGSGWRKAIYGDWLDDPHALLHCLTGFYTTDLTRFIYHFTPLFLWTLTQYATVAFELGAPLLLLYPPLRKGGVIAGCLLHVGIALLMKDIWYFSLQMLTFYVPVLIPISHLDAACSKRGHQSAM